MPAHTPQEIVTFWFEELSPKDWFMGGREIDQLLRDRFLPLMASLADGAYDHWQDTLEGRLALILACDQFSRNIFRGEAKSFALDTKALGLVQYALKHFEKGFDDVLSLPQKLFFYMPLMHSEKLADQELSLLLFAAIGGDSYKEAEKHHDLIIRFGRFPHRNGVLGRKNTPDEQAYLQNPSTSNYGVEK